MRASVIVATRNRQNYVLALLRSLKRSTAHSGDWEIIVVDDGSTDDTASAIAKQFPSVRQIRNPRPLGPARARNLGSTQAEGQLLLYLDDDGEVEADWLAAMLDGDKGARILLGNVVDFDGGRVQSVPRRATFIGKSLACRPEEANTGPSCNLAIPRDVFDAVGGFDEELPYYFEDSDLCIRARRAGFTFTFIADAVFRHHGSEQKTGEAIRMQEHNSTYAMLKIYEDDIPRSLGFSLLNGAWMVTRLFIWTFRGRSRDAGRLLRGWSSAYLRFFRTRM